MNLFNKLTITLAACAAICSCGDVLDMPEDGRYSLDDIFGDFDLTMAYVNKCYSYMPGGDYIKDYAFGYGGSLLASFCDEAQDTRDVMPGEVSNWYQGNGTAAAFPMPDYWTLYYQGIRTCNIFLDRIETAPFLDGDRIMQSEANLWKAQVHALRAFYMLQIIKRYGPAPIITGPMEEGADFSKVERASFSECVDAIIEDCETAVAYGLPWRIGSQMQTDYGMMSRAVVYAIQSQAALYAASPLWNDAADPLEKWRWAARITGDALNRCLENDYQLFRSAPDAGSLGSSTGAYQSYFFSKMDVERQRDKETIYECKTQLNVWNESGLPVNPATIRAGACPTQEMVDAYEMENGEHPFVLDADGCVVYDGIVPRINPASGYDESDPYAGRDPRLTASVFFNGSLLNLEEPESALQIYDGGDCRVSPTDQRYTRTGYYLRKFHHNLSTAGNVADGYMKIFRLGELYLNFAEAANEAYGPGTAVPDVTGSVRTALAAVNAVRDRAGMPGLPAGMPQDGFRARYRNERRVELAFEQHRFYDVRRWKILDKTDRTVTGVDTWRHTVPDDGYSYEYRRFVVGERENYGPQYLMMPLLVEEVSKMKMYTGTDWQNPGW
ncbi:MAG: RagB/SusD family nutrient uptake outer membrane protein [Rikenellaceae bacterium]|nr:RagB/SusD family nutrient uptake outer membrane protein [Rikenellaceae bacterium]